MIIKIVLKERMRKKLNEWANFDKAVNVLVIIALTLAFVFTAISCADEFYFGKSRDELNTEVSQNAFEVDSLFKLIQLQLDSTAMDFNKFYINAQRINNGSN